LFCSSKKLLLLLEQSCVHVADCNGIVLCKCRRTLPEEENCLHSSSFDHLLAASIKAGSKCVWLSGRYRRSRTITLRHLPLLVEDW
jgi:hypothetical protein